MVDEEIDRPDDLVVLMLLEETEKRTLNPDDGECPDWRNSRNGMYRGQIWSALEELNWGYFDFENFDDYGEFMDSLNMFDTIGVFGRLRSGERIGLKGKGLEIADKLEENLSEEQRNAIVTAIAEARGNK